MKFMSIRDLRNESGRIQRAVAEESVTLTSNGRPFALVIGLGEGDDPAELERLVERAKAQWAVSRVRKRAREAGLDTLSAEEVEAELAAARSSRPR